MRHYELRKHRNGQNDIKPSDDSTSSAEYCRRGKITKVIIQEHNYSDEVEIELLDGYELRQKEDGTWVATKKPRINPSDLKEGVEILYTINLETVDSSCFDFELTGKIIALQEDAGEKYYITSLGHIITEDKITEIL